MAERASANRLRQVECASIPARSKRSKDVVIRDRRHLSEDGVVVPIIAINKHTGKMEIAPEIVTRGFLPSEDGAEIL